MAAMNIEEKFVIKKPLTFLIRSKNKKTRMGNFTLPYKISRKSVNKQRSYGTLKFNMATPKFEKNIITKNPLTFFIRSNNKKTRTSHFALSYKISSKSVNK